MNLLVPILAPGWGTCRFISILDMFAGQSISEMLCSVFMSHACKHDTVFVEFNPTQ